MTTKFEDIMSDFHKRNGHLIRKAVLTFLTTFIFLVIGMIVTSFVVPIPRKTIEAWQNWKPPAKFYVFALIEYIMLFLWLWLHLNFKLLQTKADFLSDFIVAENAGLNASRPRMFTPWEKFENISPVPKGMSKKLIWVMFSLLLVIRVMSLDRQYINVVYIIALLAYAIIAFFKGQVIEKYLLSLRSNYIDRVVGIPVPKTPEPMQISLTSGLILGFILIFSTYFIFQFSNFTSGIFFFFAFSCLSIAAFFLNNANRNFNLLITFADAVRVQENIEGPDIPNDSNWSIGKELKNDLMPILEQLEIHNKRDKILLLVLPILLLILSIVLWRLFQYVKIHGFNEVRF